MSAVKSVSGCDYLRSSCHQLSNTELHVIGFFFFFPFFHAAVNFQLRARPYFKGSEHVMSLLTGCEMLSFAFL